MALPGRPTALLCIGIALLVAACGRPDNDGRRVGGEVSPEEAARRCVRALRDDALGWASRASRPGFRASRVVRVYSLSEGLPDYYLLMFTDAAGDAGAAKASLEGQPGVAGEDLRITLPRDDEIQRVLTARGMKPGTPFRWVAVYGPAALEVDYPFGPLAEAVDGPLRIYVNCALRAFVPDASGWVQVPTKDGELRLRELR